MLDDPRWYDRTRVRKCLLDAADYLDVHGWGQNMFGGHNGVPPCMVTAILMVSKKLSDYTMCDDILFRRLGDRPILWNDASGRTKEQVQSELRAAANEVGEL
jgi:hypothetical protein